MEARAEVTPKLSEISSTKEFSSEPPFTFHLLFCFLFINTFISLFEDNEYGIKCLSRLNGNIHLVLGNHDTDTRIELYESCPNIVEIVHAAQIKYKKNYFFLCHYPVITANYDDQKAWAKHLINLHGHTHSQNTFFNDNPYMYNVALDAHNNFPVLIDDIIEKVKQKKMEMDRIKED